jgi:hypothetical protein
MTPSSSPISKANLSTASRLVVSMDCPGPIHVAPKPTAPPIVRSLPTFAATLSSGIPFWSVQTVAEALR